jgi:hypothetical protein
MANTGDGVFQGWHSPASRQQIQSQGKQQGEQNAKPEIGHSQRDRIESADSNINDTLSPQSGHNAGGQCDQEDEQDASNS